MWKFFSNFIAGVECVIFANDPSVLGGALTPHVGKKWERALEIGAGMPLGVVAPLRVFHGMIDTYAAAPGTATYRRSNAASSSSLMRPLSRSLHL